MTEAVKKPVVPEQCDTRNRRRFDAATLWSNMVFKSLIEHGNNEKLAVDAMREEKLRKKIEESNKTAAENKCYARQAKQT